VAWDSICAGEAAQLCGVEPAPNDACADRIEITDGVHDFTTVGATTDGNPSAVCSAFGVDQIFNDIWYNYTATCDGTLTVHTCGASFDTRIAVYEGIDCLPTADPIGCNDDAEAGTPCSGTLQSYLEVPVQCGQVYKIRVGAFAATQFGSGQLTVSCAGTPCPDTNCPDCVTSATFAPPPDGNIDAADLAFLLGEWGPNAGSCADTVTSATFAPPPDGVVDAADLAFLLGAWGSPHTCP
jgi:hypothetical protein